MNNEKYDDRGNLIYKKVSDINKPYDVEHQYEYDKNNNMTVHIKSFEGIKWITKKKYDENNRLIYVKDINGEQNWYKYNKKNEQIEITKKEFKEIKLKKMISKTLNMEVESSFPEL